jgi:hypothetical protein|tara:strand:+ start:60 stop:713 length:654 start_codon:yes stop_codon:yes gene_type:complete
MANQTGGFGFRQAPTVGSTPATGGQAEYMVKSGLGIGIFQNNPVSQQHTSGDDGYLQDATADTMDDGIAGGADWSTGTSNTQPIVGVFNGIFYINSSTSKPTFANHVLASTTFGTDYNTGSNDGIGLVNDNPMQEYACKADAAVTQANLLNTFNPTDGATAGTQINGQSTVKLDITGTAATSQFRIVRTANDPENNDNTAANSNVIVQISPAASISN